MEPRVWGGQVVSSQVNVGATRRRRLRSLPVTFSSAVQSPLKAKAALLWSSSSSVHHHPLPCSSGVAVLRLDFPVHRPSS